MVGSLIFDGYESIKLPRITSVIPKSRDFMRITFNTKEFRTPSHF